MHPSKCCYFSRQLSQTFQTKTTCKGPRSPLLDFCNELPHHLFQAWGENRMLSGTRGGHVGSLPRCSEFQQRLRWESTQSVLPPCAVTFSKEDGKALAMRFRCVDSFTDQLHSGNRVEIACLELRLRKMWLGGKKQVSSTSFPSQRPKSSAVH